MKIFSRKEIIIPPVQMFWLRPQPDNSYKLWLMDVIIFRQNDLWFLASNRALQLRSFFELKSCFFPPMLAMIEYEGWLYPLHKTLLPRFDVDVLEKLYVNLPETRVQEIESKKTRKEQRQRNFVEQQILHRIYQSRTECLHQQMFTQKVQDALEIELKPDPPQPQSQPICAVSEEPHIFCANCNTVYVIPADHEEFVCAYCGSPIYCRDSTAQLPTSEYGSFMRDGHLQLPKIITSPIAIGIWSPKKLTKNLG